MEQSTRAPRAHRRWAICLLALTASESTVRAAQIFVNPEGGGAYTTIQAGIDAARDGDLVLVAAGEYVIREPIDFNRLHRPGNPQSPPLKNIVVRSETSAEQTIIRMAEDPVNPDFASVVVFQNGEAGPQSILQGFTLTGGKGFASRGGGGGIFLYRSSPRVNHCIITGNSASSGGGIFAVGSAARIRSCTIFRNRADLRGGGTYTRDAAPQEQSHLDVQLSTFTENSAKEGGGWFSETSAFDRLKNCRIARNSSELGGGMMVVDSSYPTLVNAVIDGNSSREGGGVLLRDQTYPHFRHCTITANSALRVGGISARQGPYPFLTNCIVWGNRGGAIENDTGGSINFSCLDAPPPEGKGNLNRSPLFVREGSWVDGGTLGDPKDDVYVEGDYHLFPGSPAIDVGTLPVEPGSGDETSMFDFAGNGRPCWKDVDMGAYEYCGSEFPGEIPPIVYVSRILPAEDTRSGAEAVVRAIRGKLMLRKSDRTQIALVDASMESSQSGMPVDVMDPDVSYDGTRIVFSGYSREERVWRIYEVKADGSGLQQLTVSDRATDLSRYGDARESFEGYDDLDPCYLPDGRICFVSTRYPESAPEGRRRATNLYVIRSDGTGLRRVTSERFGANTPAVDPSTGQIVFSRWWRTPEVRGGSGVVNPDIPPEKPGPPPPPPPPAVPPGSPGYGNQVDVPPPPDTNPPNVILPRPSNYRHEVFGGVKESDFPGVNSWFLSAIHPDGSNLAMFSGFHLDRQATQAYRPSFLADGQILALFLTETPQLGSGGRFGLRRHKPGVDFPAALGGPQTFAEGKKADLFRYASAAALPDGRIIVTGAHPRDEGPGGFDLYIQDNGSSPPERVFGESYAAELDAVPLVPRIVPPAIEDRFHTIPKEEAPRDVDEAKKEGGVFTFRVENIFANAGIDIALPNAPPFGEKLLIEFFMAPQRTSFLAADAPFLVERVEIAANGRVEVELPAGVPLFEVLRRSDGTIAKGRDGQIFHVGGLNYGTAGVQAKCVGCHAGHSMMPVPPDPALMNLAPSALVTATSSRELGGTTLRPDLLVDRRTDVIRSEWAANNADRAPSIHLTWSVPVRARDVIIYGVKPGNGFFGARSPQISNLTLKTLLDGDQKTLKTFNTLPVSSDGTKYSFDVEQVMDSLTITMNSVSGTFEGGSGAALAEIEVMGKVLERSQPDSTFVRGDANCDHGVDVTDATAILGSLFLGEGPLCCTSAGDVDGDHVPSITDPIYLLDYLFRGGPTPPSPFPNCGPAGEGEPTCGSDACG